MDPAFYPCVLCPSDIPVSQTVCSECSHDQMVDLRTGQPKKLVTR